METQGFERMLRGYRKVHEQVILPEVNRREFAKSKSEKRREKIRRNRWRRLRKEKQLLKLKASGAGSGKYAG